MRTFVFDVPEGETLVGQILVTIYEPRDFEGEVAPGDWTPEEKIDVAVRPRPGSIFGPNSWGPPLELAERG